MRKKLFAVIMSAMMMITFMPAMAFAAEPAMIWSSDFSTLTMSGTVYSATRTFNDDGTITATANGKTATYYDFTNAAIVSYKASPSTEQLVNMTYDDYLKMIDQSSKVKAPSFTWKDPTNHSLGKYTAEDLLEGDTTSGYAAYVRFALPEGVTDGTTGSVKKGYEELSTVLSDVDLDVELQKYEAYDDVKSLVFPVTFTAKSLPKTQGELTDTFGGVINTSKATKNHTVYLKMPAAPKYITYTMAGLDSEGTYYLGTSTTLNTYYCAEDQNLTITAKNITAKFRGVLSADATDKAPEMVKANENGYKFYIQLYRGTDKLGTETLYTVEVDKAPFALSFKSKNINLLPGQKVTAADIMSFKTEKAGKIADIFSADKAVADKIFKQCVALDGFPTQTVYGGEDITTSGVLDSKFNTELKKLVEEDLEVANFFDNYKFDSISDAIGSATVYYGVEWNDVTAPNQTKTFHVKNASKLKANKTFKLKATADYGTLSFTKMSGNSKIKVAKNGKVTVKKGLKKGKYVVKVKVKAPGAKATKKLTVKVVK